MDASDVKEYSTIDLKDMFDDWKKYKVYTVKTLKSKGIDPFDDKNWSN